MIMLNVLRRCRTFVSILLLASTTCTLVRGQEGGGRRPDARQIEQAAQIERQSGNGIFVDDPKVYDDSSLQLMLNAARARLAAIQAIDQTGLLSHIGSITGASLSQSALGVSVMGPPIPQSVVTASAPAGSTAPADSALPVQSIVTTNPALTATAPAPPANGGVSMPSTNAVSAIDALNEQMQLTYEIANLQLLLEGSLNDRFVKGQRFIKPRATLGFPITISPQSPYKNAVAVVEVEVENPAINLNPDDRPAVTALLPREKTYNVAALTDHMTSIGGGLVTQVVSGGFSLLRGRKSYYIVQDQDTLAVMQPGSDTRKTAFSWQFRPVLGQSYVRSGLKQTFVQLAAPLTAASGCFGKITIRTYWRRVDRKTGVLKEVIPESISDKKVQPIPVFDLAPLIEEVEYDDLGAGQIRVTVAGKFLGGTYIRVGNNYYREGSPGFTSELTQIRFVASAAEVAKYKAFIVSRDGAETPIIDSADPMHRPRLPLTCTPTAAAPDTSYGFALSAARTDQTVSQGETTRFTVTVATASGFSSPIVLTHSDLPTVVGVKTGWSAARIIPPANSSVTSTFTVETTAATAPGDYDIQLFGNAGAPVPVQSVNVKLHVLSRITTPTVEAKVFAFDDSRSVVKATLTNLPANPDAEKYLMVIRKDRVFGLADAPIEREPDKTVSGKWVFRAIVPNSLLNGAPKLEVKPLFWKDEYTATGGLETSSLDNTAYKVAVLSQTGDPVTFLLYGSQLTNDSIKNPAGVKLDAVGSIDPKTLRTFKLTKEQWGGLKQIALQHSDYDRPVFVDLPQPEGPPKITLTAGGRVVVGTEEVTVTGYTFDKLKSVVCSSCSGKPKIDSVPDGKSVKLRGLVAARVTSIAGEPEIQFEFEDGKKLTLKLDVVTSKVEEVTRDKPQP
jgi:hypothetical protein